MTTLSESLDHYENYTRGMLSDIMGLDWRIVETAITQGIFKPTGFNSILLFSTLDNTAHINFKLDDYRFVYTAIHININNNEILLFIRENQETGFYYFGRCNYIEEVQLSGFRCLCILDLIDTKFSKVKELKITGLEKQHKRVQQFFKRYLPNTR